MEVLMIPFVQKYRAAAIEKLEAVSKRPLTPNELDRLDKMILVSYKDKAAVIHNSVTGKTADTSVGKLAGWFENRPGGAIITGHGSVFQTHSNYNSVVGEMVEFLLENRKVLKDKMFKLMHEGRPPDDPEVKALDVGQKLYKLLAVSFYGAYGERGFHFYNPALGPAVTYTGQLIIASTMFGFESLLFNNLWLRNRDEMARHIATCITEIGEDNIEDEWGEHPQLMEMVTPEYVTSMLVDASAPGWKAREYAEELTACMNKTQLLAIALRGDPHTFMTFPNAYADLQIALSGEIREADPGKLAKTHPKGKAAIERIIEGIKKWVAIRWLPVDLTHIVPKMVRRSVLLVDTDSNFINLHPWMQWLSTNMEGFDYANEQQHLTGLNIMVYILYMMSRFQMDILTKNMGVPEDKRILISFKSEFVIKRMVLTDGKKNYVALMRYQEGARIIGDKADFKGLSIRKSTVARDTGRFFEASIEKNVLRSDDVNRSALLHDVVQLEDRIRTDMKTGGMRYATPATLGNLSAYADKYAMPVVRGAFAWNAINEGNPIREGSRINLFRTVIGTDANAMADALAAAKEGSPEHVAISKLLELFFGTNAEEGMSKNGFNWIAIPRTEPEIPVYLRQFIDSQSVINANTAPIYPILEATGLRVVRSDPEMYSNIIRF